MREIKYRAWFQATEYTEQKYSGMYDVIAIDFGSRVIQVTRASVFCQQIFSFDDVELLEYTGFKDIKGQEIYIGDTVVDWNTGVEGVHSPPYLIKPDDWTLESIHPACFPMVEVIKKGLE